MCVFRTAWVKAGWSHSPWRKVLFRLAVWEGRYLPGR
jgi:hypothetical protein